MLIYHQFSTLLASIARRIYIRQGLGVGTMKDLYGDAVDHGVMPSHHGKASGKIIRYILHQLERKRLIEHIKEFTIFFTLINSYSLLTLYYFSFFSKNTPRRVTSLGRERFDRIACLIASKM